jgi:hypothetical protein
MRSDISSIEDLVTSTTFTSNAHTLAPDHNLTGSTLNKSLLLATPGYAALAGVPEPDFIIPAKNFFNINGDTHTWRFAVGDGTHPPTVTFASGNLPTDGTRSMSYDLTLNSINSPTNFAGDTGTVSVPEPTAGGLLLLTALTALLSRRRRTV